MASSGKKKTTMAKLTRESRLRERRLDKQARKDARKRAPALDPDGLAPHALDPDGLGDPLNATTGESAQPDAGLTAVAAIAPALEDA
jgi:hypothetical protein